MLRDELLQSKNDEIARCLLSRKRKLSELYFATVGFPGATDDSTQHNEYRRREQEFLDANDITKGRFYNENTLPRRPDIASPKPLTTDEKPDHGSLSAGLQHVKDGQKHIPDFPSGGIKGPSPELLSTGPHGDLKPKDILRPSDRPLDGIVESKAVQTAPGGLPLPPKTPSASHEAIREKEISSPASTQQTVAATVTPVTDVDMDEAPDNQGKADTGESPTAQNELPIDSRKTVAEIQDNATGASLSTLDIPEARHGKHTGNSPCLAADLSPKSTDQPLSPASSRGHPSSTTSVSEKTPTTSPAKEQHPVPQNEAPTPPKSRESVSGPTDAMDVPATRRAPVTPDEQLKFEAAQSSMQQAAVEQPVKNTPYGGPAFSSFQITPENSFSSKRSSEVAEPNLPQPPQSSIPAERRSTVNGPLRVDTSRTKADSLLKTEESRSAPTIVGQPEGVNGSPLPSASRKASTPSVPTQMHFQPERMTTRVSSGAIRHRSVSEILGETPKSADKAGSESPTGASETSQARSRLKDRKDSQKERSKLSTVVFPKQQSAEKNESLDLVRTPSGHARSPNEEKDYLYTLFQAKAHYPPRSMHLNSLLSTAHKTLTTANHFIEYQEQMDCRSLKRIYQLQHTNRWPLRQLQRSAEPDRSGTHWDILLDHMKWMRTDFREERKWKIAAAKRCADWCAEYVASDEEQRAELRIPARIPPVADKIEEDGNNKATPSRQDDRSDDVPQSQPTPDLVSSLEDDSVSEGFNDEIHPDMSDGVVPAAIFSLGSDEFSFGIERTPAFEKILEELPLYSPLKISPETNLPEFKRPPDSSWRKDLLPVSKYATGKIKFSNKEPPRKRSRYDYHDSDDDADVDPIDIPPEQTNVALFQPQNKHIRDRIHPGLVFRPPTEFPMPSLGFYECRQPSQWTYAEEDELKRIVKEYSFNWSLISACLSSQSLFTSGADRRTPWECFEKWVQLDGLPAEMSKTPYFKAYTSRVDSAQRTVLAAQQQALQQQQAQLQSQQQGNNPPPTPTALIRRRPTTPMRVERKRASRHLALLDGMRKLSKKRETLLQKQAHATQLAASRKLNEVNQPRPPISTPAEFSRLKHEREVKIQESQEQYKQAMMAQRMAMAQRVAQQQQAQQQQQQQHRQIPNQQPMLNGVPNRNTGSAPPNGVVQGMPAPAVGTGLPNGLPVNAAMAQARTHPGMQMPNGTPVGGMGNPGMGMKIMAQSGIPQAINGRPGIPPQASPDNARIMREANRVQEEQQRMVQSRQQQLQGQQQSFIPQGPHSSPNMNMGNMNPNPNNPTMLAFQAASGVNSPSFHAPSLAQGVSNASPRINHNNPLANAAGIPSLSSIQSTIQRNNPNMTPDQVNKLAAERHHHIQQQRMSQVAMNAAAGNMGSMQTSYQMHHDGNMHQLPHTSMPNGGPSIQTPQTQGYSPMMRVAQTGQPSRMGVNGSPAMNAIAMQQQNRNPPPQVHRSASGQGGPGPGQGQGQGPGSGKSPRPPQAQTASS